MDACDAMGARAYATGAHVVLGARVDLHTVAHEAAYTLQQRAGRAPAGGVSAVGDDLERHADRVADQVVRGQSAEALLDEIAPRISSGDVLSGDVSSGCLSDGGAQHATSGVGTAAVQLKADPAPSPAPTIAPPNNDPAKVTAKDSGATPLSQDTPPSQDTTPAKEAPMTAAITEAQREEAAALFEERERLIVAAVHKSERAITYQQCAAAVGSRRFKLQGGLYGFYVKSTQILAGSRRGLPGEAGRQTVQSLRERREFEAMADTAMAELDVLTGALAAAHKQLEAHPGRAAITRRPILPEALFLAVLDI